MKDSSKVIVEAPLSFAGSRKRILKLWYVTENQLVQWLLLSWIIGLLLIIAWSLVLCWYCIFGLWLVPYRLVRRSSRKAKQDNLRHQELIATLDKQNDS